MAVIGSFGAFIVFETSDKKILNFNSFKRTVSARWTSHPRNGYKPLKQFIGPDAEQISFSIVLDAQHGVKPRDSLEIINTCIFYGIPAYLVIGVKKVGVSQFVITQATESWNCIWNHGELVRVSIELTLEEYPD